MKARKILSGTLLLLAATATLAIVSCDKDKNKGGGGTTTTPTTEDFITFNGITVKKPTNTRSYVSTDTILEWGKNSDTVIWVGHEKRAAKTFNIAGITDLDKDVVVNFKWGSTLNSPAIIMNGGSYELKRENGKWVTYIKNGTGKDATHGNAAVSGISARLTWPN